MGTPAAWPRPARLSSKSPVSQQMHDLIISVPKRANSTSAISSTALVVHSRRSLVRHSALSANNLRSTDLQEPALLSAEARHHLIKRHCSIPALYAMLTC